MRKTNTHYLGRDCAAIETQIHVVSEVFWTEFHIRGVYQNRPIIADCSVHDIPTFIRDPHCGSFLSQALCHDLCLCIDNGGKTSAQQEKMLIY